MRRGEEMEGSRLKEKEDSGHKRGLKGDEGTICQVYLDD